MGTGDWGLGTRDWGLGTGLEAGDLDASPQSPVPSPLTFSVRGGLRRPDGALIRLGHRRKAFVDELLQPLSAIGLGGVDVALRVGRDAVHGIELTRLAAAVAEARELGERLAIEDVNLLVGAVGEIHVFL